MRHHCSTMCRRNLHWRSNFQAHKAWHLEFIFHELWLYFDKFNNYNVQYTYTR
jgi:hypothetical protein